MYLILAIILICLFTLLMLWIKSRQNKYPKYISINKPLQQPIHKFHPKPNPHPKLHPKPNHSPQPNKSGYKGLCIFDWDGTIDSPDFEQSRQAAKYCVDQGYAVAGLTAGLHSQQDYINKLGMPLYKWAEGVYDKGPLVNQWATEIRKNNPIECVILFDDSNCANFNKQYGINTQSILRQQNNLCVYQNSCYHHSQINKDQVKFAIDNCKNCKTPVVNHNTPVGDKDVIKPFIVSS